MSGLKASNTIAVHNPGAVSGYAGSAVNLNTVAADNGGPLSSYTATGLPAGTAIRSTGYITGTPTAVGSYTVGVTARDATGASGHTTFHWTVAAHPSPSASRRTSAGSRNAVRR